MFCIFFSTRFGHTTIPDFFNVCKKDKSCTQVKTRDQFNQPKMCKEDNFIDNLIRGMLSQELEARDVNFVEDVRDHLFDTSEGGVNGGKDLVALSIQVIT